MSETLALSEAGRIAQFMGLRRWNTINEVELVEQVAKGLPTSTLETIVKKVDPSGSLLDVFDLVPKATFYRRKEAKKPLTKDQSEMVFALSKVFSETIRLYSGDRELAAMFLAKKHPMLGGRSPIDVARESTAGADLVLTLLARAEAGVAV
ncbi:MAG: antitoxin Xre/MbcA/ParS toxin-binding domain-containing protein [Pseudomonadota bacterium]